MLSRSYRLSMRAGGDPLIKVGPGVLERATSRHHANMASLDLQHALILAADLRHDALRLAGWRDMIGQRDHIEQVRANTAHVHLLATNAQRALHEPVLLAELLNELSIGCPGHADEIGDTGVHGVAHLH